MEGENTNPNMVSLNPAKNKQKRPPLPTESLQNSKNTELESSPITKINPSPEKNSKVTEASPSVTNIEETVSVEDAVQNEIVSISLEQEQEKNDDNCMTTALCESPPRITPETLEVIDLNKIYLSLTDLSSKVDLIFSRLDKIDSNLSNLNEKSLKDSLEVQSCPDGPSENSNQVLSESEGVDINGSKIDCLNEK
ncbi:uncharacterized protein LOC115228763 [Octopus sinensis]|uniref:Uncharacterized protein LOC115228763 n=1 Tax=Octopus sinensis TaxID=2607531 RepID=A0A6P7TTR1_9MOLL|nr:uncharacterized protein LOC115228763 [Octopus sinensis]